MDSVSPNSTVRGVELILIRRRLMALNKKWTATFCRLRRQRE